MGVPGLLRAQRAGAAPVPPLLSPGPAVRGGTVPKIVITGANGASTATAATQTEGNYAAPSTGRRRGEGGK